MYGVYLPLSACNIGKLKKELSEHFREGRAVAFFDVASSRRCVLLSSLKLEGSDSRECVNCKKPIRIDRSIAQRAQTLFVREHLTRKLELRVRFLFRLRLFVSREDFRVPRNHLREPPRGQLAELRPGKHGFFPPSSGVFSQVYVSIVLYFTPVANERESELLITSSGERKLR